MPALFRRDVIDNEVRLCYSTTIKEGFMKAMRNMPQLSCTVRDEDLFFINRIAMHMTIEKGKPVTVSEAVRFIFANARREWTEKNK